MRMSRMSDDEVEMEIQQARTEEGTYPIEWVVKMNKAGVWFSFLNDGGVRWSRTPFNLHESELG